MTAIIGLDLSLTSSGVAIKPALADNRKEKVFAIPTTAKEHIRDRWKKIVVAIKREVRVGDSCFIEDYAYGMPSQRSNLTTLAEVGGIIKFMLLNMGVPIFPVSPGTLKKWATGKGNAKKEDMKLAVYKKFDMEFETSDEADAFLLADFGSQVLQVDTLLRRKLMAYELAALVDYRKKHKL